MAYIFPDAPLGTVSPEVARLYRLFKQLPERLAIWHRLAVWTEPGPDFWILNQESRALLLKVSPATPAGVEAALTPSLFGAGGELAIGTSEELALSRFIHNLNDLPLPSAVLFPHLTAADLERIQPPSPRPGITWASKETLALEALLPWLEEHLGPPLSENGITALRQAFAPEVVIPSHFTVRQPIERHTQAGLTNYLLDYDQERVLKTDLDLSAEARATMSDFNLRLVNGVAGSGKSLVIVYRAHLLRQLYPAKAILGLTHNRPLIRDLQARYKHLAQSGESVEWLTFYQWCYRQWPRDQQPWHDPIGQKRQEELTTQIWHAHLADTAISERMFREELDWFKDRLLFTREDYLGADRAGRGFALTEALRQKMFTAFEAYQRDLDTHNQVEWADVPRQLWKLTQNGTVKLAAYDVVLVDEAQFFAPLWFELIKQIVKPQTGHLFLAADPTQGFLKRRQSWAAVGLEVRGRSHRLTKSYRTTREILDFATLLYRTRVPEDDDDIVTPDLLNMPGGTIPEIIPLTSAQDEITRVVNEISTLVKSGIPKKDILVIHTGWRGCERLLERLQRELGEAAARDPKEAAPADFVRVCTLNAVTGLESPIVFLAGVRDLYEQEQSVRLSDEERLELIRDNTRKLYMAITRAGQRLVLTYVGDPPETLVKSLLAKEQGEQQLNSGA